MNDDCGAKRCRDLGCFGYCGPKWLCTDCNDQFQARHLRPGNRCPICGGARTIPPPDDVQRTIEADLISVEISKETTP